MAWDSFWHCWQCHNVLRRRCHFRIGATWAHFANRRFVSFAKTWHIAFRHITAVIKKAGIASCMCWHVNDVVSTSYMSSVVVTFNTHTLCGCGFKFSSSVPSAALLVRCCVFVVGALFVLGVVPLWPLLCLAPCDQTT
jgi:hypothetical protein